MAGYSEFIRMYKVVEFVKKKNKLKEYPSNYNILTFLKEKGYKISKRTLVNDLATIRADFRTELSHSKRFDGYYINEEESDQYDSFFRFLEIASLAEIFNESLKDNKKILDLVSFDDSKSFEGIENLKPILLALSQERELIFKHINFKNESLRNYIISPLLLKEYENRWYVLGVAKGQDEVWSFGIDRMNEISIGDFYQLDKEIYKEKLEKYNDIIGVSFETDYSHNKIKVVMLIDKLHVKYLKSLPLHSSQEIHPINKDGKHLISYFLIPNYEFETQILKMGDYAEVISPLALRDRIKSMLSSALDKYI